MRRPPAAGDASRERTALTGEDGTPAGRGLLPPFVVFACSTVFFWSISFRFVLYNLMPVISADLGLSASMAGIVISGLLLGYTSGTWLAGWLPGSRKGRVLGGVMLTIPAVIAMSYSRELPVLLVSAATAGFGAGIYLPLGVSLIFEAGGRDRGARYMSVQEVFAALASFGGSAYVAVALLWMDWASALLAWCVVGVAAVIVFSRVRSEGESHRVRASAHPVPLGFTLAGSILANVAATILLAGLIGVLPLIMVNAWGVELASAASLIGYTRLAGLAGVVIAGLRADRWGHRRTLYAFQMVSLLGISTMAVAGYGPLFVAGLVAVAAGASGGITLLPIVIASAFSPQQRERALATTSGVGGLIGMVVSPALFGVMLDVGWVIGPMVVSAGAALLAIVATRWIVGK